MGRGAGGGGGRVPHLSWQQLRPCMCRGVFVMPALSVLPADGRTSWHVLFVSNTPAPATTSFSLTVGGLCTTRARVETALAERRSRALRTRVDQVLGAVRHCGAPAEDSTVNS